MGLKKRFLQRDGCMLQVRAFLQPPMQGVVLQTYGAGNAPSNRADIIDLFHEANKWGVLIVNISQCSRGNINAAYATGKVREWFSETLRNDESVQTYSWSRGEYIRWDMMYHYLSNVPAAFPRFEDVVKTV